MKKGILIIPVILTLIGCGGKKDNPAPIPSPVAAILTAPALNAVCTTGTIISTTQSSVLLTWNAAANADSYDLYIKNLLTSTVTTLQNITATQFSTTLLRGTPYSWYVVSKSSQTPSTAQSDTWKFYNAGLGVLTYAPFPAEIISPTFGQVAMASAGAINLSWKGSSVITGTIVNYDVYFGTTNSPVIIKSAVTDSFLNGVSVVSGTTYYWKVITRDAAGNTSDSGLYQFTVQ